MENLGLELFTPFDKPTYAETHDIVDFLHKNTLDSKRRDKTDIRKSIDYALKERTSHGGYITIIRSGRQIAGVSILNKTGLEGILPDYIMSYLAVDRQFGTGSRWEQMLLKKTLELCNGNVAFLVQANNPMVEACPKIRIGFQQGIG